MKKDTTHSALLGLTQGQMAQLLQLHPSQWSMYESGKRDIPLKAKSILSEMLGFLKFEDKGSKVRHQVSEQEKKMIEYLEKLLRKNEFELYEINKRIELAEKKYKDNLGVIGLVEYLMTLSSYKKSLDVELLEATGLKAQRALQKFGLAYLTELRIKEELLRHEELLLKLKLDKIN